MSRNLAARDFEAAHALAEGVVIPVVRGNADLVAAVVVAVETDDTVGAPLILPVDGGASAAGGLGAAAVTLAVPLTGTGGEDPGIGHGEDGGEGGDGSSGELHLGGLVKEEDGLERC